MHIKGNIYSNVPLKNLEALSYSDFLEAIVLIVVTSHMLSIKQKFLAQSIWLILFILYICSFCLAHVNK